MIKVHWPLQAFDVLEKEAVELVSRFGGRRIKTVQALRALRRRSWSIDRLEVDGDRVRGE